MAYFYPLEPGREAWGSKFTPSWNVAEKISAAGRRRAMTEQNYPSWKIELAYKGLTDEEANELQGFYCLRKGSLEPFYYKDYGHHKLEAQRLSQTSTGAFQCVANIGGYVEPVSYVDNLKVYVDGVQTNAYTVSNGKITLSGASGTVTADYEYYLKVHFSGSISISQVFENVNNVSVVMEVSR